MIPSYIFSFTLYGIITPYLPIMVSNLGYNLFQTGILLGIFEGAGIAGPFVFGCWADRGGSYRKPLAASILIPALAVVPLVLFVHPLISALLLAVFAFAFRSNTSLLDAVTTINLGGAGNYGHIRVTGSISFILMVLFLQWTPVLKPSTAENIAAWTVITSAAALVPVLLLPGSMTAPGSPGLRRTRRKGGTTPGFRKKYVSAAFFTGFAVIFLCRLAMTAVYTYFPLYLTEELHWNVVGFMFALASAAEAPCMFISGRLLRRFSPLFLLSLSAAGITIRLLAWALFPFKGVIIAAQLLHSLCFGIYHPAAVNFIVTAFPPEKRAVGMSLYLALGSGLPSFAGNIFGGFLAEAAGYRPLFAVYAAFTGLALVMYGTLRLYTARNARNP
ncbi:MAG: MFS transporter [Treponema sp.]|jgi:PPP family 3-phenylpropionic acid transporter|nr:MFS transporter [Treponema sp.]